MTEDVARWFAPPPGPPPVLSLAEVRAALEAQAALIVETGTGGRPFDNVDAEYQERHRVLMANLERLGIGLPYPWASLWEWYGYYSQELPTYRSRRENIRDRTRAAVDTLNALEAVGQVHDPGSVDDTPTWDAVNVRLAALITEFTSARDRDTWQDVGRRSREILIDLGKLIADPMHVPDGREHPRAADARAWFDLFLTGRATGTEHKELRAMMRATWDLAQKVTHGDISDADAFASAQAVVLLVRTTQMLRADDPGTPEPFAT